MKPTDGQSRLTGHFAKYGAPEPTTKSACHTLLDYLLQGKHSQLPSCSARLALFRKWTGATVKITRSGHPYRGRLGKVINWRMRPRQEIAQLIKAPSRTSNPFPFMAIVKLDRVDRPVAFSLSDLKVITHGEQRLLFALHDQPSTSP